MTFISYKTAFIWEQIKGQSRTIVPGRMFLFWYNKYKHDRMPMALMMKFEPKYNTFQALNFHYIHPDLRLKLINSLESLGLANDREDTIFVDYDLISEYLSDTSIFLRRYKISEIVAPRLITIAAFKKNYWQDSGHIVNVNRQLLWNQSLKEFANKNMGVSLLSK